MAKIVCPKCGFKNQSKEKICVKCGYYIATDQFTHSAPGIQPQEQQAPPPTESVPDQQMDDSQSTLVVNDRSRGLIRISLILTYVLVLAMLAVVYYFNVNLIVVFPVLIIMWVISPIIRRRSSGVRFTNAGFTVNANNSERAFEYDNIASGELSGDGRRIHFLTLSLKNASVPVRMEFPSIATLRMLVVQMNRRGISVTAEGRGQQKAPARMM